MMEYCEKCKKTPRDEALKDNLIKRLNKISGQINGINKMIQDNRYCHDVLIQISAAESALKEVGYLILEDHMLTCVSDDIKDDNFDSLKDALEIAKKLN